MAYVVVVSILVVAHGYVVNERAEGLVWQSLLESELAHFVERKAADPEFHWTDTDTLRLYGPQSSNPFPPEFSALGPGVHDERSTPEGQVVTLIANQGGERIALELNISKLEVGERSLATSMAFWVMAVFGVLSAITYLGAGWLVGPLSVLTRQIDSWAPERVGERISVKSSAPNEVKTIATALNGFAVRFQEFLERERRFVSMASHELRTPISVIASAAEVAIDTQKSDSQSVPYLNVIRRTAGDMERLVTLLLTLAKDPARIGELSEVVELQKLLPDVIKDYNDMADAKRLCVDLRCEGNPIAVSAPTLVVRSAVGNLIRNAIENSDLGTITVTIEEPSRVVIADPGHGMSEKELSILYARVARNHDAMGSDSGIGIDLVARLCEHLGWSLDFMSQPGHGTTATLDFGEAEAQPG